MTQKIDITIQKLNDCDDYVRCLGLACFRTRYLLIELQKKIFIYVYLEKRRCFKKKKQSGAVLLHHRSDGTQTIVFFLCLDAGLFKQTGYSENYCVRVALWVGRMGYEL